MAPKKSSYFLRVKIYRERQYMAAKGVRELIPPIPLPDDNSYQLEGAALRQLITIINTYEPNAFVIRLII